VWLYRVYSHFLDEPAVSPLTEFLSGLFQLRPDYKGVSVVLVSKSAFPVKGVAPFFPVRNKELDPSCSFYLDETAPTAMYEK